MERIVLDLYGDADLPEGYELIEGETSFLRNALSTKQMLIKGSKLCGWAEQFYLGRGIRFGILNSFLRELLLRYPALTEDQAKSIRSALKSIPEQVTGRQILEAMFPSSLWRRNTDLAHAAKWLIFLDTFSLADGLALIISDAAAEFSEQTPLPLRRLYSAKTAEQAHLLLEKWIFASDAPLVKEFGRFPIELPVRWAERRRNFWNTEIIESHGMFVVDFLKQESRDSEKIELIDIALKYFRVHPESLEIEIIDKIRYICTYQQRIELEKVIPIALPSPLPQEPGLILDWFSREYLPYRLQAVTNQNARKLETSITLAQDFGLWFLDNYYSMLAMGKYFTHLKVKELSESQHDEVSLLLLMDGLNAVDSDLLKHHIQERSHIHHLDMVENYASFSALPTVTEFTKKHILAGSIVVEDGDETMVGTDLPDKRSPLEALQAAKDGQLVIWRLKEPDATYHKESDTADLSSKVDGALYGVANSLEKLFAKIDPFKRVRIVITADHGRMLGKSQRNLAIPKDFEAHGRAAWGVKEVEFGAKGYTVEGDMAYLSGETYMFHDKVVVVALSDAAFEHNRYGEETSPHGGVFPEEVIVPWLVFVREADRPQFSVSVSGAGEANKPGELMLNVLNPSDYNSVLESVALDFGLFKQKAEVRKEVWTKQSSSLPVQLEKWPSQDQVESGKGRAAFVLPNGETIEIDFDTKGLQSKSLYKRTNILDGLE